MQVEWSGIYQKLKATQVNFFNDFKPFYNQSCSVSKKTFDLTVTRGTLWSDKL